VHAAIRHKCSRRLLFRGLRGGPFELLQSGGYAETTPLCRKGGVSRGIQRGIFFQGGDVAERKRGGPGHTSAQYSAGCSNTPLKWPEQQYRKKDLRKAWKKRGLQGKKGKEAPLGTPERQARPGATRNTASSSENGGGEVVLRKWPRLGSPSQRKERKSPALRSQTTGTIRRCEDGKLPRGERRGAPGKSRERWERSRAPRGEAAP